MKTLFIIVFAAMNLSAMKTVRAQAPAQSVSVAWEYDWPYQDGYGFRIIYGTQSGASDNVQQVNDPAARTATIGGLAVGGTYFFRLTAVNQAGLESPPSNELAYTVPIPIVAPSNLTVGDGELRWAHASSDLDGFNVYEVAADGSRKAVGAAPGSSRSFVLGANTGTRVYQVTAVKAGKESLASNSVSVNYPSAPLAFRFIVEVREDGSVRVLRTVVPR